MKPSGRKGGDKGRNVMLKNVTDKTALLGAGIGHRGIHGAKGKPAFGAVWNFVITAPRVSFKEHSPLFLKLLSNRFCFKLTCQIAAKVYQFGHAFFKAFVFINGHLKLCVHKRQVVAESRSAGMLVKQSFTSSHKGHKFGNWHEGDAQ